MTYAMCSLWKHMAVKHFKSYLALIHIVGQSALLIVFLSLVCGMTFKGYKYGNYSTIGDQDHGKWEYGENICLLVVSIALLVELALLVGSMVLTVKRLFFQILSMFIAIDEKSTDKKLLMDILKPLKKRKVPLERLK